MRYTTSRGSFCFSHYSAELHHRQNKPNRTTQEALVHHRTATGAQAAAVSWHQGRRRFSVQSFHDPRLSPGTTRVTQNQFTLLAVHSDILCVDGGFSGSTRYCEHAWSDQPGAIPTGKKSFWHLESEGLLWLKNSLHAQNRLTWVEVLEVPGLAFVPNYPTALFSHPRSRRNQNPRLYSGRRLETGGKKGFLNWTQPQKVVVLSGERPTWVARNC